MTSVDPSHVDWSVDQSASRIIHPANYISGGGGRRPFMGARVTKSVDQTSISDLVNLTWDQEDYDIGGWHDNATNNDRLTVPAGITRVRLSFCLSFGLFASNSYMIWRIQQNGSVNSPVFQKGTDLPTTGWNMYLAERSQVVDCVPGDYFVMYNQASPNPDVLADLSYFSVEAITNPPVSLSPFSFSTAVTTGDGAQYYTIPSWFDGTSLMTVRAQLGNAQSTSGTVDVQLARGRFATPGGSRTFVDMLSTPLTIDANEWDSKDATTPAVIDAANDDVLEGDIIRVDVDAAGTGAQGLFVDLLFN